MVEVRSSEFDAVTIGQLRAKNGAKWSRYGPEVLPSFVADMDFALPDAIHEALVEQAAARDFGYTLQFSERPLAEIFSAWAQRRYQWSVAPSSIVPLVDLVQGMHLAIQVFSEPGDGVVVLTPTYPPMWQAASNMGRELIACELQDQPLHHGKDPGKGYAIDFELLRSQLNSRTRLLLLCNPHNPTGRVFRRDELEQLAELALEFDLVVVADEIHCDLVFQPHQHIPFASLSAEVAARTITLTSATKTFNLGGMRFAIAVFGSPQLQARFQQIPPGMVGGLNSIGILATEIAWRDCDPWLDSLLVYLQGNRDYLVAEFKRRCPSVAIHSPESTFLAWLDCRAVALNCSPHEHFLNQAKVAYNNGEDFAPTGGGGEGFVRLNFATSRQILSSIVDKTIESIPL